ncbi:flagellar export protein FliJ [Fervidobacterium sp. 2310opik-2]|uniref:flagellar export protein FliJ n=1 Tax=Fervidobacterium sp. 2310opik-2 TaxID=1755815 RepID=UPI0013DF3020|nr:flagellar export protein FliJ [Fervidobacterium sp. 2310opik-2]KAF2962406.1 flagellar export protein FliJ [Fervidobacterium sp. 2310opik-2]HOJ94100.1 flagellar export protein FliJ [Fervidobacterium nodosum]
MPFRLEKILTLRKKEEESIKEELNRIRLLIREVEDEIDKVKKSKNDVENQLRTGTQTGAQLGFLLYLLRMYNDYILTLKKKLENLRLEEEEILRKFLEKRTERKSFEKLKERYIEKQSFENDRKERATIDEVALQKYFRNIDNTRG